MSKQPPVFTDPTCDGEPGKDFDCRIRYEPLPGDVRHDGVTAYTPRWGGYWDHLKAARVEEKKKQQEGKDVA